MSSLMLSCADSDREDRPHHRDKQERMQKKDKTLREGKKANQQDKKIRTQPVSYTKKVDEDPEKEDLEKAELLVEKPLDSESDQEEEMVVVEEGEDVDVDPVAEGADAELVAEGEGADADPVVEAKAEEEEKEDVDVDLLAGGEGADEAAEGTGEDIFSITHAGKEGDRFVMRYKSQELVLNEPLACVLLTGVHFNELRIEDGTDFMPVICGADSACEPGNYSLVNNSWVWNVWDDYDMELSEYNDDFDCQEFPVLEE